MRKKQGLTLGAASPLPSVLTEHALRAALGGDCILGSLYNFPVPSRKSPVKTKAVGSHPL